MQEIRFDDVGALKARVGEPFGAFGMKVEITQAMIQSFAELTGDQQWIHVDVARCERESPFGAPIAHGFLTLSLVPGMRPPSSFRIVGFANAVNYGADTLRFLSPVPAGSRVHTRARLCGVESKGKGTLVTSEIAVHVVGSEKPAIVYKALILYQGAKS